MRNKQVIVPIAINVFKARRARVELVRVTWGLQLEYRHQLEERELIKAAVLVDPVLTLFIIEIVRKRHHHVGPFVARGKGHGQPLDAVWF